MLEQHGCSTDMNILDDIMCKRWQMIMVVIKRQRTIAQSMAKRHDIQQWTAIFLRFRMRYGFTIHGLMMTKVLNLSNILRFSFVQAKCSRHIP